MSLKNILNCNLLLITYGLNNDNVIREVPILMEREITLHFVLFQRKKTVQKSLINMLKLFLFEG